MSNFKLMDFKFQRHKKVYDSLHVYFDLRKWSILCWEYKKLRYEN
jgi:hypothetical protein